MTYKAKVQNDLQMKSHAKEPSKNHSQTYTLMYICQK